MASDGLSELKSVLRSLVVSSPTRMDMRNLMRDYRDMMGKDIPTGKYGYRDVYSFLKERCDDCFLFAGPPKNPTLTLIVPDSLIHIDKFVQKQRIPSTAKFKCKRLSIPESVVKPKDTSRNTSFHGNKPNGTNTSTSNGTNSRLNSNNTRAVESNEKKTMKSTTTNNIREIKNNKEESVVYRTVTKTDAKAIINIRNRDQRERVHEEIDTISNQLAVQNFLRKRLPALESVDHINEMSDSKIGNRDDDDSGRLTASSGGSSSRQALKEEIKQEIKELLDDYPEGIWCAELMRKYRHKYGRELRLPAAADGVAGAARAWRDVARLERPAPSGDWLLLGLAASAPPPPPPTRSVGRLVVRAQGGEALPGVAYDADVFPADCMQLTDSVTSLGVADVTSGDLLEVCVAEVYSPSHLWLQRLGTSHKIAMEALMDEMNAYFAGPGRDRYLSPGAVQAGQYCAAVYEGDWHRALIVHVVDADMVKIRHCDYGTVCRVRAATLRPMLREWSLLPAQAVRARLAGLRPAGAAHWPPAAAAAALALVRERALVAQVTHTDVEEEILEVYLIDTSTSEDICINEQLIQSGFAESRTSSTIQSQSSYLRPSWSSLETGASPSYGELVRALGAGLQLRHLPAYRRHVLDEPCGGPRSEPLVSRVVLRLSSLDVDVFAALRHGPARTAAAHMLAAITRARQADDGDVILSTREADVFTALAPLDPALATRHLANALQLTSDTNANVNPYKNSNANAYVSSNASAYVSSNTHKTQNTTASLHNAASTSNLNPFAQEFPPPVRPPPGFENYRPHR